MSIVTQNNQNLKKMSLSLATKELSRKELKGIMAGSGSSNGCESGKSWCPSNKAIWNDFAGTPHWNCCS